MFSFIQVICNQTVKLCTVNTSTRMNHVRIENKQVALFDCGVSDGSGSVCECNLDYAKPKNEYYEDFSFAIPSSPEPAKGKNSLKIYLNNSKVRHSPKVKLTKENYIENK